MTGLKIDSVTSTISTASGEITLNDVIRTAPASSGGFEVNNTSTGEGYERVLTSSDGGVSASVALSWKFDNSTVAADPGSKQFRLNNSTLASVTAIYFDSNTNNNIDPGTILSFLTSGNRIYMQQQDDATRAALFEVSGTATNNTGWWTVPVTVVASSTLFQNNKLCVSVFAFTSTGGGGGISNVVEDTTPQLGGDLDVNGHNIVSVSNGDITISPNGTGVVALSNTSPILRLVDTDASANQQRFTIAHANNNTSFYTSHDDGTNATSWLSVGQSGSIVSDISLITGTAGTIFLTPGAGGIVVTSDLLLTTASTTTNAMFRLPHGSAPSSPTNGDVWTTTSGLFTRINGVTVGPYIASASPGGATTNVQFNNSGSFGGSSQFTFTDTALNPVITLGTQGANVATIMTPNQTSATQSSDLTIKTGTRLSNGTKGGDIRIIGGDAGNSGGFGGAVFITTGNGATGNRGGALTLTTGNGDSDVGGPFRVVTGTGTSSGTIGFSVGGVSDQLSMNASSISATLPILAPAASSSAPSIRLPHGSAPSSPTNGDLWTTTTGLFARINGATVGPYIASAAVSTLTDVTLTSLADKDFFVYDSGAVKWVNKTRVNADVGYLTVPQNLQNGDYTLALTDSGKHIYKNSGGAGETITIPANGSIAFPVGTAITIVNRGGGTLSVAITTDTLQMAGGTTTGTRTLADGAMATLLKVESTIWMISGAGIT